MLRCNNRSVFSSTLRFSLESFSFSDYIGLSVINTHALGGKDVFSLSFYNINYTLEHCESL